MKIKYSALVSGASGKLNGSVAARNRYGNYFRNKTTPINRDTTPQQRMRAIFGAISKRWSRITESQREAWENLAKDHPYTDIFGDSMTLQASAMFQKVNLNLEKLGLSSLDAPGSKQENGTLAGLEFTFLGAAGLITELDLIPELQEAVAEDTTLVVYATRPVSAGKKFLKNDFRMLGSMEIAAASVNVTEDILPLYTAVFGDNVADNQRIGVRVAVLDVNTGLQSTPFSANKLVLF